MQLKIQANVDCQNKQKLTAKTNLSNLTARESSAKLLVRPPVDPMLVLVVNQLVQMGAEKRNFLSENFLDST